MSKCESMCEEVKIIQVIDPQCYLVVTKFLCFFYF